MYPPPLINISYESLLESIINTNVDINNALHGCETFISESYGYDKIVHEGAIIDACKKVVGFLKNLFTKFVNFIKGIFKKIKLFFTGGRANIKKEKAAVDAKEKIAKAKGEQFITVKPNDMVSNDTDTKIPSSTDFTMRDGDTHPEDRKDIHNKAINARHNNREDREIRRLENKNSAELDDLIDELDAIDVSYIVYDLGKTIIDKCYTISDVIDGIADVNFHDNNHKKISLSQATFILANMTIQSIRDSNDKKYDDIMAEFKSYNKSMRIIISEISKEEQSILKNPEKWSAKNKNVKKNTQNYKDALSDLENNIKNSERLLDELNKRTADHIGMFQTVIHSLDQSLKYLNDDQSQLKVKNLYDEASIFVSEISRLSSKLTNVLSQFFVRLSKMQVAEIHKAFNGKVIIS